MSVHSIQIVLKQDDIGENQIKDDTLYMLS